MTYGTPLQHSIAKLALPRTSSSVWGDGRRSPWWSDMRMLLQRVSTLPRHGLTLCCPVRPEAAGKLPAPTERTNYEAPDRETACPDH